MRPEIQKRSTNPPISPVVLLDWEAMNGFMNWTTSIGNLSPYVSGWRLVEWSLVACYWGDRLISDGEWERKGNEAPLPDRQLISDVISAVIIFWLVPSSINQASSLTSSSNSKTCVSISTLEPCNTMLKDKIWFSLVFEEQMVVLVYVKVWAITAIGQRSKFEQSHILEVYNSTSTSIDCFPFFLSTTHRPI